MSSKDRVKLVPLFSFITMLNDLFDLIVFLLLICRTCTQFLKLVQDRRLWKTFDLSTKKMMGGQIKKLLSTMQIGDIKEFKVRGFVSNYPLEKWKNNTITPNILRKLSSSCQSLETMELRESHINFDKVRQIVFSCFKY